MTTLYVCPPPLFYALRSHLDPSRAQCVLPGGALPKVTIHSVALLASLDAADTKWWETNIQPFINSGKWMLIA